MKYRSLLALTTSVLMCLSTASNADENEIYVTVFGGASVLHDFKHGYTHLNPVENGNSTHDLDTGYVLGAAIGASFWPHLRNEIELSHSHSSINGQSFDNPIFTASSGPSSGHIRTTTVLVNTWYDFELMESFRPYIGGGIGLAHVNGKSLLNNSLQDEFDDSTFALAFQAGVGSRISLTDRVDIDLGYRFRATPGIKLKSEITGQGNKSGNLYGHNFQVGLTFKLN